MKVGRWIVYLLIVSLLIGTQSGLRARYNGDSTPGEKSNANVDFVKEPVEYRTINSDTWRSIEDTGLTLPVDADVKVGDDAALSLRSDEFRPLKLNEQTGVQLRSQNDSPVDLEVVYGSTKMNVKSDTQERDPIKIKTKQGIIGVRGTDFGVSYERPNQSEVFVTEGLVSVNSGTHSVEIPPGKFASFGLDNNRKGILKRDSIQPRHRTIWKHWTAQRFLYPLREQRESLKSTIRELRQTIDQPGIGDVFGELNKLEGEIDRKTKVLEDVKQRIDRIKSEAGNVIESYQRYRNMLEERRGSFLKKRKQILNQR